MPERGRCQYQVNYHAGANPVIHRRSFKARSARSVYESHHGPNMTPMVDVVMVILVFFMASAAILGPEWFVRSSLPIRAAASKPAADSRIVQLQLTFDPENQNALTLSVVDAPTPLPPVRIDGDLDLARELAPALASVLTSLGGTNGQPPNITLVALIAPAPTTRYERVVAAHEACLRAGITRVGTQPPGS